MLSGDDNQAGMLMERRPPCEDLGGKHSGQMKSKYKVPGAGFSRRLVQPGLVSKGQRAMR